MLQPDIKSRHRAAHGPSGTLGTDVPSQSMLQGRTNIHGEGLADSWRSICRELSMPFVCLNHHNACRCLELTDNNPSYHLFAFGTGYLNVLGQAANLACSAYLTADCIDFMVQQINGHQFTALETLLTYASESRQRRCMDSPSTQRFPHLTSFMPKLGCCQFTSSIPLCMRKILRTCTVVCSCNGYGQC